MKTNYLYFLAFLLWIPSYIARAGEVSKADLAKDTAVITPEQLIPGNPYRLPSECQRQAPVHYPHGIDSHNYRAFCTFEAPDGEWSGCQIDVAIFPKFASRFAIYTCPSIQPGAQVCPRGSMLVRSIDRSALVNDDLTEFPGDLNEQIDIACPH